MKTIADVLGVARSHLHERVRRSTAPRRHYRKAADEELLPLIRRVVDERPTSGYRRVTALVNRFWPQRASQGPTISASSGS